MYTFLVHLHKVSHLFLYIFTFFSPVPKIKSPARRGTGTARHNKTGVPLYGTPRFLRYVIPR